MAQVITVLKPSGSTNGRNVKVAATSSAGTLIHTADSSALDIVELWACNTSTSSVKLTLEVGGTTSPDDLVEVTILPESGWKLVLPGVPLTGGVIVSAFAGTGDVININGRVTRYTTT